MKKIFLYKKAVVPDENSAMEIATAIFNNMENSEYRGSMCRRQFFMMSKMRFG